MYAKCYICFYLGLLIANLSILFYLCLNLKKMRKIYSSFYLISVVLLMAIGLSSCSENQEDIAAPSIIFKKPVNNETIQVIDDSISITVEAADDKYVADMEMIVKNESGAILIEYDNDDIKSQNYTCDEKFYLHGLTKTTRMKLIVKFKNEFQNWNEEEIDFYVKP